MKKYLLSFLLSFGVLCVSFATCISSAIDRVEPPFWWAGMENPVLQLMIYGEKIGDLRPTIQHPGVRLEKVTLVENANYVFLDLSIAPDVKAGRFKILFQQGGKTLLTHDYELKARNQKEDRCKGFDASDVLYLITPDRFANSLPDNDEIPGLRENLNRSNPGGRHGGDIQGIIDHLDYIKEMGFTAIWLNPVLENDMEEYSYHGYSTTDYYKVDPRYGTNEDYQRLSELASQKGIKLIMDMIVNHCGSFHWWMKDLPSSEWIHFQENPQFTNHRKSTILDPYVSARDRELMEDGWFVETMPDLNQDNELMATYLVQNTIWWVEYLGLSGIRQDTYPYNEKEFIANWSCRIMEEYPEFNIVGEEWTSNAAIVAYWQGGKVNPDGYTSCLPGLMDFPLQDALTKAINEEEGWSTGWKRLYEALANDFLYADPEKMVVFPDNHDMMRIFSQLNEDYDHFRLALSYILTIRGIPQLYYGTEVLMSSSGDHGDIRSDFPGGWARDTINGFNGKGLTEEQLKGQQFVKKLLNWRKGNEAVHNGKLMHFLPEKGIYVYFRYTDEQRVMVVLNKNKEETVLELNRFSDLLNGFSRGKDILTDKKYELNNQLTISANGPMIIELNKR